MLLLSLHFYPALRILCNESVPYGRESVMTLLPMCASGFFLLSVLTWQQLPKAYGILHHGSVSLCSAPASPVRDELGPPLLLLIWTLSSRSLVLLRPCICNVGHCHFFQ